MRVVETVKQMREVVRAARRPLGLVPTMGALHEGHLSLVRRARQENDVLMVSIFVNPSQFGPQEDFANYPRNLEHDLALLSREDVDLVFAPSQKEMYPPGFDTGVELNRLGMILEGRFRPGHFRGVATVVLKLLNICRPDRAYFGRKDAQQSVVVRRTVEDLNLEVEIVILDTVREPDGLAISSRNVYLNREERRTATVLSQALFGIRKLWEQGLTDASHLRRRARKTLEAEPLVVKIDYISIADAETLDELNFLERPAIVSTAVRIGRVRLIDNILLDPLDTS